MYHSRALMPYKVLGVEVQPIGSCVQHPESKPLTYQSPKTSPTLDLLDVAFGAQKSDFSPSRFFTPK